MKKRMLFVVTIALVAAFAGISAIPASAEYLCKKNSRYKECMAGKEEPRRPVTDADAPWFTPEVAAITGRNLVHLYSLQGSCDKQGNMVKKSNNTVDREAACYTLQNPSTGEKWRLVSRLKVRNEDIGTAGSRTPIALYRIIEGGQLLLAKDFGDGEDTQVADTGPSTTPIGTIGREVEKGLGIKDLFKKIPRIPKF